MPRRKKWAVVGGGMLGLVIALRLARENHEVSLIEAGSTIGGLTSSFTFNEYEWDRFYHVIEAGDKQLLALIEELDLLKHIKWGVTKTNFYDGNDLYPLNDALDYIRLPALGLVDKVRLGINILYAAQISDGAALETLSAEQWLVRWSGRSAFENLWRPLLRAKLGDNFQHASAAFIWATIKRFYGARQGQRKTELFGYIDGGYARLIGVLRATLQDLGVEITVGSAVQRITRQASSISIECDNSAAIFDHVVVTTASPVAAQICHELSPSSRIQHESIRYQGVVCPSVLLRRPLGGAYLTYITGAELPFTTVIEMSSLTREERSSEFHLAYLPKYVPCDDTLLKESDAAIELELIGGLKRMFPDLNNDDIVAVKVARAKFVSAIATLNYSANLPPIATNVDGLYICNSANVINAALSVNETVSLADRFISDLDLE